MRKKSDIIHNVLASQLDDVRIKIRTAKKIQAENLSIEKNQAESLGLQNSDVASNLFQQAVKDARPLSIDTKKARSIQQSKKPKNQNRFRYSFYLMNDKH